ncbi:MAG: hypothetical protein SFV22_00810, partial [Saprospiraceae bacterium]|nr:hypothetical protein [Saprospiraceae bacterium]
KGIIQDLVIFSSRQHIGCAVPEQRLTFSTEKGKCLRRFRHLFEKSSAHDLYLIAQVTAG